MICCNDFCKTKQSSVINQAFLKKHLLHFMGKYTKIIHFNVVYVSFSSFQSVGHDEGLMLMERADPLLLLVSLPLVPVGLVLGKMIRWEDAVRKTGKRDRQAQR